MDDLTPEEIEEKLVERGMVRSDAHSWAEYWNVIGARVQIASFFKDDE